MIKNVKVRSSIFVPADHPDEYDNEQLESWDCIVYGTVNTGTFQAVINKIYLDGHQSAISGSSLSAWDKQFVESDLINAVLGRPC